VSGTGGGDAGSGKTTNSNSTTATTHHQHTHHHPSIQRTAHRPAPPLTHRPASPQVTVGGTRPRSIGAHRKLPVAEGRNRTTQSKPPRQQSKPPPAVVTTWPQRNLPQRGGPNPQPAGHSHSHSPPFNRPPPDDEDEMVRRSMHISTRSPRTIALSISEASPQHRWSAAARGAACKKFLAQACGRWDARVYEPPDYSRRVFQWIANTARQRARSAFCVYALGLPPVRRRSAAPPAVGRRFRRPKKRPGGRTTPAPAGTPFEIGRDGRGRMWAADHSVAAQGGKALAVGSSSTR